MVWLLLVWRCTQLLADQAAKYAAWGEIDFRENNVVQRNGSADMDFDLERRVKNYLRDRHMPMLRNLEVEAHGGTVTLRGTVNSFYEKQLSQQCCRRVAGVVRLIDAIDVADSRAAEPVLS